MDADDHRPFGELLRRYRSAAGVTQEELAERAGITAKAVGALERGERRQPWPDTVRRLATGLGLSEDARAAFLAAVSRQPVAASLPTPQWRLPAPLTPLVGRRREVADVRRLLAEARLVTLTGVGGTGKTRLALQVAAESRQAFPGGTLFVDLAPVADPRLVPPTLEHAVGAQQHSGATPVERMVRFLGERRVLLVLDNFEHVLEAAPVVTALLSGAPELRVLATSRVLLHLSVEHEYRVPPLSLPSAGPVEESEAVRLFVQAARAARPDFVLTEANQTAVAEICARLDGLPLAIELAAARIRLFAPEALLAQLANRLEALTGRRRDLPARQQTLRQTFDWSYALLAPAERGLLAALGVFAGGFTPRAVAAVWPGHQSPADVLAELEALHESGLVERVDGPGDELRFRLLETVREYALARLAESGEVDAARRRHAAYSLALAETTEPALQGAQQLAGLARLQADYPNLNAALDWMLGSDRVDDALRLGSALWPYWLLRGLHHEAHARAQEVLAHPDAARRTAARARALLALGGAHQLRLEPAAARPVLEEALGLSRELGDPILIARAQQYLGIVVGTLGDHAGSSALLEASLATWRERGDRWNSGCTLYYLAAIPLVEGRHERAQALYEEAVAEFEAAGDRLMVPNALRRLGHLALRQGDHARAATWYGECLARSLDIGDRRGTLASLVALAGVVAMRGRLAEAVGLLGAAEAQLEAHQVKLFPLDQAQYDRLVSELGPQLDGAAFAAAWAAGRAMTLAQATAAAMEIS